MNAIIVYNTVDFFKAYRNLQPETWLVWIDTSEKERRVQEKDSEMAK